MENAARYIIALFMGVVAALEPTLQFAIILLFAILFDCLSAYDLSRRLKKQFPNQVSGKFESHYALKMLKTFIQAYSTVVLLHWVDVIILKNFPYLNLSNIGAAVFCAIQLWSIFENISSANGAGWAKKMQKIMIDKAKRHFDVDLTNDKANNTTHYSNAVIGDNGGMQQLKESNEQSDRKDAPADRQREPPGASDDSTRNNATVNSKA